MTQLLRPRIPKFNSQFVSFILVPVISLIIWNLPLNLDPLQQKLLGLMVWTILWWILETLPLGVTALAASAGLVLLGISDFKGAFAAYSDSIIFLFLGGFLLARAFEVHQLDKRLSLFLMTRDFIAKKPQRIVFSLMLSAFVFSMWLSNTATIAMLLPIALGICRKLFPNDKKATAMVLISMAYSASLGGTFTPVGSPPNLVAIAFLEKLQNIKVGFLDWVIIAAPFSFVSFALLSFGLIRSIDFSGQAKLDIQFLKKEYQALGPLSDQEKSVMAIFFSVVFFWIAPNALQLILGKTHPVAFWLNSHLPLALTAVLGAVSLFLVRVDKSALLEQSSLSEIDWSTLFLFGGGLALGTAVANTGLAQVIFAAFFSSFSGHAHWILALTILLMCIFFTEFSSNTATANIVLPLILSSSMISYLHPTQMAVFIAIACSCAFMMPIATPPNAIVYGSKEVPLKSMMKTGLKWNFISWTLMALLFLLKN